MWYSWRLKANAALQKDAGTPGGLVGGLHSPAIPDRVSPPFPDFLNTVQNATKNHSTWQSSGTLSYCCTFYDGEGKSLPTQSHTALSSHFLTPCHRMLSDSTEWKDHTTLTSAVRAPESKSLPGHLKKLKRVRSVLRTQNGECSLRWLISPWKLFLCLRTSFWIFFFFKVVLKMEHRPTNILGKPLCHWANHPALNPSPSRWQHLCQVEHLGHSLNLPALPGLRIFFLSCSFLIFLHRATPVCCSKMQLTF